MKLKALLFATALFLALATNAQWNSRSSIPSIARAKSAAFNINDQIFMMGGIDNSNIVRKDFWQYDISTDTWSQKTNFPGEERYGAVAFVLNGFGYIVAGGNDNGYLDDLWEYDATNNFWLQKTGLPVTVPQHDNQRVEAFSFVVNNKAYVGGGSGFVFGANQTFNYAFSDLWEYDPIADDWTQKSGIPDFLGRNMSIAASINGKGYVGLGCDVDQTVNRKSFWEYDPSNDTWTAKADFPSDFSADAGAVVYNSELYVVGGVNMNPVSLSDQVYKYDPVNDSWLLLSAFNGNEIAGQFAITTSTSAFIGGGYNVNIIPRNDLWEISSSITAVAKTNAETAISVYPNPVHSALTVFANTTFEKIEIFDQAGRSIRDVHPSETIDVSFLESGSYILKLTDKQGKFISKAFIKR